MRVLFLTHRLPYAPNRGDRIRAYHILRMLATRADVHLISLVHGAEEAAHALDFADWGVKVTIANVDRVRNFGHGIGTLATRKPLTHALLDAPGIRPALHAAVAEDPPDVVLAYCSGMARFALEPPLSHIPFVLDLLDVDSEKWAAYGRHGWVPRRWIYAREARCLARFEATAVRRAAATLVVNERERASLSRLAPAGAVHVVPNGVDGAAFRCPQPPARGSQVVFCGVMNYRPNEEGAIWMAQAVWPLIRARCPDARLLFVGSDPSRAVRKLAKQDTTIEVTGTVPDVRPYLWQSAVSVAPLWTAQGVQNKVIEAVAAGLPAVVTPIVADGLPRCLGPACSVAKTAEAFAAEVLELLQSTPTKRRDLAEQADIASLGWTNRLSPLLDILAAAARGGFNQRLVS